ncbi:MAG: doxx family protein [Roseivirga sp.]|nr:doxx family protein [Roseivirga sp.]
MVKSIERLFVRYQYHILRICIAILFLWFGALKFFPGVSQAEELAIRSIGVLTFDLIPDAVSIKLLAFLEVSIGILLIGFREYRLTFWLLLFHMVCTITPLFLLQSITFRQFPFQLTLEGQYIVKNIVIICAAFMLLVAHRSEKSRATKVV